MPPRRGCPDDAARWTRRAGGFLPPMGFGPPPGWYPPQRQSRGFGRTLLTTFATTIFGISLMLNVYLLLLSGLMGDKTGKSDTILEGDPKQVVQSCPSSMS